MWPSWRQGLCTLAFSHRCQSCSVSLIASDVVRRVHCCLVLSYLARVVCNVWGIYGSNALPLLLGCIGTACHAGVMTKGGEKEGNHIKEQ